MNITICDRCKRKKNTIDDKDRFQWVFSFELCPKCFNECVNLICEFVQNKNQKEESGEV